MKLNYRRHLDSSIQGDDEEANRLEKERQAAMGSDFQLTQASRQSSPSFCLYPLLPPPLFLIFSTSI